MKLLDQLKTTQGKIPVSRAELYRGEDGIERIHFITNLNKELVNKKSKESGNRNAHLVSEKRQSLQEDPTLEDLAFLWDDEGHINRERIGDLATKTGPLFSASEYERLSDWIAEASMAKDMISIQEVVNGDSPVSELDGFSESTDEVLVAKSIIRNKISHSTFSLYSYTLPLGNLVTADFYIGMPSFPHFKKFIAPGRFDYVFINHMEEEGESYLLVTLFAFKRDITALDFALALDACSVEDEEDIQALMVQAEAEANLSMGSIAEERKRSSLVSSTFEAIDASLEKDDLPHVQRLVQAVVSLRLMGIGVDVFRSNESDDFLLFPMYSSYLWYSFSKKLGQVKIGYCELCGRGFSLTGHRGMPRRFCSEECKTKAKNMRAKYQRDEIRRLFLEDKEDVQRIAEIIYDEELKRVTQAEKKKLIAELCKKVRHTLSSYPKIKRRMDNGLLVMINTKVADNKLPDCDSEVSSELLFVHRCVKEAIFSKSWIEERIKILSRNQ